MKRRGDNSEELVGKNILNTNQTISRGMMQSNPVLITSMVEYLFWRNSLKQEETPLTLDEVWEAVCVLYAGWSVLNTQVDKNMIAQIMFEYVQTNTIVPLWKEKDDVRTFGYKIAPAQRRYLDDICFRIKPPVTQVDAEIRQMYIAEVTTNLFGDSN